MRGVRYGVLHTPRAIAPSLPGWRGPAAEPLRSRRHREAHTRDGSCKRSRRPPNTGPAAPSSLPGAGRPPGSAPLPLRPRREAPSPPGTIAPSAEPGRAEPSRTSSKAGRRERSCGRLTPISEPRPGRAGAAGPIRAGKRARGRREAEGARAGGRQYSPARRQRRGS